MKICIPFKPVRLKFSGGPSSFLRVMTYALKSRSLEICTDIDEAYDILLVIISENPYKVWRAKRRGAKVIQRLDGAYYRACKGWIYPLWNIPIKIIHQYFTDFIIYQSQFSRKSCERFLGKSKVLHQIIMNPVDLKKFYPQKNSLNTISSVKKHYSLLTTGIFRRDDMILPLLESIVKLRKRRSDFTLKVIGRMTRRISKHIGSFKKYSYIEFLDHHTPEQMAVVKNASDVYCYASISNCPNDVIEALASGLPIVAFERGGVPELVDSNCAEIIPHTQNEFDRWGTFNTDLFAEKLDEMMQPERIKEMSTAARRYAEDHFDVNKIADQYIEIFKRILQ